MAGGLSALGVYGTLKFGFNTSLMPVEHFLTKHGLLKPDDITRLVEHMDQTGDLFGSKIIAKAWTDPEFKSALMKNANKAISESGITVNGIPFQPENYEIRVVENTESVHHFVVCTLCSCYPINLLGNAPEWYKSLEYRYRAIYQPRALLEEFGLTIPQEVKVKVHDSNRDIRYIVMPQAPKKPAGVENLDALVTRDLMIGVRRTLDL